MDKSKIVLKGKFILIGGTIGSILASCSCRKSGLTPGITDYDRENDRYLTDRRSGLETSYGKRSRSAGYKTSYEKTGSIFDDRYNLGSMPIYNDYNNNYHLSLRKKYEEEDRRVKDEEERKKKKEINQKANKLYNELEKFKISLIDKGYYGDVYKLFNGTKGAELLSIYDEDSLKQAQKDIDKLKKDIDAKIREIEENKKKLAEKEENELKKNKVMNALKLEYQKFCNDYRKLDEEVDKNFNSFKEKYGTKIDNSTFEDHFKASEAQTNFAKIVTNYEILVGKIKHNEEMRLIDIGSLSNNYAFFCSGFKFIYEKLEPKFSDDLKAFYSDYCEKGNNSITKYDFTKYGTIKTDLTNEQIGKAKLKLKELEEKFEPLKEEIDKKWEEEQRIKEKERAEKERIKKEEERKKKKEEERINAELATQERLKVKQLEERKNLEEAYSSKTYNYVKIRSALLNVSKFDYASGFNFLEVPKTTDLARYKNLELKNWCNTLDLWIRLAQNCFNAQKELNDKIRTFLINLEEKIINNGYNYRFLFVNGNTCYDDINLYKNAWMIKHEKIKKFVDIRTIGTTINNTKGHEYYVKLVNEFNKSGERNIFLVFYNNDNMTNYDSIVSLYDGIDNNTLNFLISLVNALDYHNNDGKFNVEIGQIQAFINDINNIVY